MKDLFSRLIKINLEGSAGPELLGRIRESMHFVMGFLLNYKLDKSSQPNKGKEMLTLISLEIISMLNCQSISGYSQL